MLCPIELTELAPEPEMLEQEYVAYYQAMRKRKKKRRSNRHAVLIK